jgi:hypothetical protein
MTWNSFLHMTGLIRGNRLRRVSDLTMDFHRLARWLVALIEMPTPETPTHAFFVAVVLPTGDTPPKPRSPNVSARVFSLEAEHKETGVAGEAVMGEWARDGRHLNYGRRPCNREAFLQCINEQLNGIKTPWWKFWTR